MRFFIILLSLSFLSISACNKGEKPVTLADDKIYADLQKELEELDKDQRTIEEKEKDLDTKMEQLASSPKFVDLLKKQKFTNGRNLEFIQQAKNYLRIRVLDREKYFAENSSKWKMADLDLQFKDYSINKKANPVVYPWRIKPPAQGPQKKEEKSAEAPAPAAGGHGGGHGETKPAEKPAAHH